MVGAVHVRAGVAPGGWRAIARSAWRFSPAFLLLCAAVWFQASHLPDPAPCSRGPCCTRRPHLGNGQWHYSLAIATVTHLVILSFDANAPRFVKRAFAIEGLQFALLFASTGLGIILGQLTNNRLIVRLGVLATTRIAAFVLPVVMELIVLLLRSASCWAAVRLLMFAFNTSFMVVMANAASLVIDPHREIAGFASSAYGFLTQMTASVVAVLTVPLFDGRLLPWSVSMLAVATGVFIALVAYRPPLRGG